MIKKSKSKWFSHRTNHPEAKINLICFVFAGGSPSFFAPWRSLFPSNINLIPILYQGRETRTKEILPEHPEQLIQQLIKDEPSLFDKPYALWGHCSGSLLGLELAYTMIEKGNPPIGFIVSGCEAPQHALRLLPSVKESFDEVKDEDIISSLRVYNLLPEDMLDNPVFRNYFLPTYRADLSMFSKYKYENRSKLTCPALIMNGTEDIMLKKENIDEWDSVFVSPIMKFYSGEHYFVNDHKEDVKDSICKFIDEACYDK